MVFHICLSVCRFIKGNICRTFAHCLVLSQQSFKNVGGFSCVFSFVSLNANLFPIYLFLTIRSTGRYRFIQCGSVQHLCSDSSSAYYNTNQQVHACPSLSKSEEPLLRGDHHARRHWNADDILWQLLWQRKGADAGGDVNIICAAFRRSSSAGGQLVLGTLFWAPPGFGPVTVAVALVSIDSLPQANEQTCISLSNWPLKGDSLSFRPIYLLLI